MSDEMPEGLKLDREHYRDLWRQQGLNMAFELVVDDAIKLRAELAERRYNFMVLSRENERLRATLAEIKKEG